MSGRTIRPAALCAVLVAATAWAGVDVEIRNGDKVTGTLFPATEVEVIRFRVPKDALITVKAAAGRKGPKVRLDLKDPVGDPVTFAEGKVASITRRTAAESGVYSVEVRSMDHVTAGDYSFSVSWKSKASYGGKLALSAGSLDLPFSADAGATATFSAKKVKKSAAVPALSSLTYVPELGTDNLVGATDKRVIGRTGDFVLNVTSPADGDVMTTVKVRSPRPSNRKYALTTKAIGGGDDDGDTAFSSIVGPTGAVVTFPPLLPGQPGAQLNGSSIAVPAGALPVGTSIVIATSPDLPTLPMQYGAGPTVAFGPEGLVFGTKADPKIATITIPFDPAFGGSQEDITIYTRNAKGVVTAVLPKTAYVFDLMNNTVSFPASHFSSFRAVSATPAPAAGNFITLAQINSPRDVCNAFDPEVESPGNTVFYVAEGAEATVGAIRIEPTVGFVRQTWVGGGTQQTLPAGRTQFQFPDLVVTVNAMTDGTLFVGTRRQIFRVDATTGTVTLWAGTGALGDSGDDGDPTQATFTNISNIVADAEGALYVVDGGAHRIRFITASGQVIDIWAGNGSFGVGADGGAIATTAFIGPSDLSIAPDGGVYVADGGRIRLLNPFVSPSLGNVTVAGQADGDTGSGGDGGPPTSAAFQSILGISQHFDPVNPTHDAVVVVDAADHTARIVDFTAASVTLVAGAHGTSGFNGDMGSSPGLMHTPLSVAALPGLLCFADTGNSRVRLLFLGQ